KARMSMISDYMGNDDSLVLEYDENGYSFLFDVEVDENGNLLNYSRDFYVKFAGEEADNTGLRICHGRETRHAIENIYMRYEGEEAYSHQDEITGITYNTIFSYDQDTIDSVRQEVAGWLFDNGYASVQDVLHTPENGEDINAMMAIFDTLKPQP
nr:hypothetical protein [Cyanobacteria bacterium RUI128]